MGVPLFVAACGAVVYWHPSTSWLMYEVGLLLLLAACGAVVYWHPWTSELMYQYPWIRGAFTVYTYCVVVNVFVVVLKSAFKQTVEQKWLQSSSTDREANHQRVLERQRRLAKEGLKRSRERLKACTEDIRGATNFADTAKKCTAAIHSLNEVTGHIRQHGDVDGSTVVKKADRKLKMQLYTQRSAARIKLGRYRSAAVDYARVLNMGSATKDYVLASTPGGGRKEMYLRKGDALIMAGDVDEAGLAYQRGLFQQGIDVWDTECTRGVDNVHAVKNDTASAKDALESMRYDDAKRSAERALARAPNYELAQKLILDALMDEGRWSEARRRCEMWAYQLERCNWGSGRPVLGRFAKGGGPPGKCISAMHVSLQEGYCTALRNVGTRSDLNEALTVACKLRLSWALDITKQRQTDGTGVQDALSRLGSEKTSLEQELERQAGVLSAVLEGHERESKRFEEERKHFASEMRCFETSKRGFDRERTRLLGPLAEISERSRETLASIPDLDKVLEDCVVCQDCLLKDIAAVSFGVMSYSCACGGTTPRKMHVDCIVSMNELTCPLCRSRIVVIAPSLMSETRNRTFTVNRSSGEDESRSRTLPVDRSIGEVESSRLAAAAEAQIRAFIRNFADNEAET